ncbi:response regulator [bacterium]|nr:response regulator [bacterium]
MAVRRILVADDETDMRMLISGFIQMAGWTALEAGNGRDVLQITAEKNVDAVLLDWQLGGSDAIQVFHKLKERKSTEKLPCILLCSEKANVDKEQFKRMGFSGVLSKSFSYENVIGGLNEILGPAK